MIGAATGFAFELGSQIASGEDIDWAAIGMTALEFGVTCAEVGGITGAALGGGLAFGGCFVAGTEVATPEGNTDIKDIAVGDTVLARNDKTGETEEKEVTETYVKQARETVKLTVDGEEIETTKGHPVYVENKGYIAASQLRAGDILVDVNGEKHVLEKVRHELKERPISVYNFAVADNHNYYVGKTGVLVHNVCLTEMILSGKQAAAVAAYAAFTGLAIAEILTLLTTGVLTWTQIYTHERTGDDEIAYTKVLDEIKEDPPKNEARVYNIAYILVNAPKMTVMSPRLSLTEATFLVLLLNYFDIMSTNGLANLSDSVTNILIEIARIIINERKKLNYISFGVYTYNIGDASILGTMVYRMGLEFDLDITRVLINIPENHFDVYYPHQVHYNHYHVDFNEKNHFWFDKRVRQPDRYTSNEDHL